jgi:hypothetical protein
MSKAGRRKQGEISDAGKAAKKGRIAAAPTAGERHPLQRMIKEVIVRYRYYGDPEHTERWFRLYHEGSGGAVDCFVLSSREEGKEAMKRLYFKEGSEQPKEVKPDGKSTTWKSTLKHEKHEHADEPLMAVKGREPTDFHCVWVHEDSCTWYEICDERASKAAQQVTQETKRKTARKSGRSSLK